MPIAPRPSADGTADDDERIRIQRERYRELLEELRTILPGVQVLFAFLLTAPFSTRFSNLDDLGRYVYAAVLLGVALTMVLFLAPAALHRLDPTQDRSDRLRVAVVLVVCGLAMLGLSVSAAVFLVVRFVFDSTGLGLLLGGAVAAMSGALWFSMPLFQRREG